MPFFRGRRLRQTPGIRAMVRETTLRPEDFIQPYFVVEADDAGFEKPTGSMPGQSQLSTSRLLERVGRTMDKGLTSCILFGIPKAKDPQGGGAYAEDGELCEALRDG